MNRFDISDLSKPLIVAPMAGGPSTPSSRQQPATPAVSVCSQAAC